MKNGNPEVCELKIVMNKEYEEGLCETEDLKFLLNVNLYSSSDYVNQHDLLGTTIQIGRPLAREIVSLVTEESPRDVIVDVVGKEYKVRVNLSLVKNKWRIMDIEKSMILGNIRLESLRDFAGKK